MALGVAGTKTVREDVLRCHYTQEAPMASSVTENRKLPMTAKGRKRREAIKQSAAELLKSTSYHKLTLEQITSGADIPTSVFYHYFANKDELVIELLDDMFREYQDAMDEYRPFGTFERGIDMSNLQLLKLYDRRAGLVRAAMETRIPEFTDRWRENVKNRRTRIANGLREFTSKGKGASDIVELKAISSTLSVMSEGFAYEYCILGNTDLKRRFANFESAADFLTTIWTRALFLGEPNESDTSAFTTLKGLRDRDTTKADD